MCHLHVFVLTLFDCSTFLSLLTIFSLIILSFLLPINFIFQDMWWTNSLCTVAHEDLGTLAEYDPLTGYDPNEYHITEATEPYIQESSVENGSPTDVEYDDATIGKALSSPLFTQEGKDDACRGRANHSQEEGLSSNLSSFVSHDRTGRPVVKPFDSQISSVRETPSHSTESEQISILLDRQREQILADCQAEIRKHEFQVDYDRRSKRKIYRAHQGDERLRRDQQLLHEQLLKQNWDLREAHEKSHNEMEELKRFQGSTFDTIAKRKLVEDRDTILELTGKIQELQNEINGINDSRDFRDAESVRSGQSHVTSQPVFFSPHPDPGGMVSRSLGMPEHQKWAAKYLGHTWYIWKRFCKSNSVFFSTLSARVESMEFSHVGTNSLITGGEE